VGSFPAVATAVAREEGPAATSLARGKTVEPRLSSCAQAPVEGTTTSLLDGDALNLGERTRQQGGLRRRRASLLWQPWVAVATAPRDEH